MPDLPLEDLLFVIAAASGGVALLLTNRGDAVTTARVAPAIGSASLRTPLFAFVAMVGIGGLVASRVLDVHGVQAFLAATGAGVVAMGLALMVRGTRRPAKD
jgi:hypothetical protein